MPLVDSRPLTPGQRFLTRNKQEVSKKKPERRLVTRIHDKQGRNCYGRITSRRRRSTRTTSRGAAGSGRTRTSATSQPVR